METYLNNYAAALKAPLENLESIKDKAKSMDGMSDSEKADKVVGEFQGLLIGLMMKSMQINAILTHQLKVKANDGGFGLNTPMAKAIDDERKAVGWKCKEDVANIAGIGPKTMKCLEKAGQEIEK